MEPLRSEASERKKQRNKAQVQASIYGGIFCSEP